MKNRFSPFTTLANIIIGGAIILSGCGGGGENQPPPTPTPVSRQLAGPAVEQVSHFSDKSRGCVDGNAKDILLGDGKYFTIGADGVIYLVEKGECDDLYRIRKLTADGVITTVARSSRNPVLGPGELPWYFTPHGIAVDKAGNIYVPDGDNYDGTLGVIGRTEPGEGPGVWRISPAGAVEQLAGFAKSAVNYTEPSDGIGAEVSFGFITNICFDGDKNFYLTEVGRIRKMSTSGEVMTILKDKSQVYGLTCGASNRSNVFVAEGFDRAYYYSLDLMTVVAKNPGFNTIMSVDNNRIYSFSGDSGLFFDRSTASVFIGPLIDQPKVTYTLASYLFRTTDMASDPVTIPGIIYAQMKNDSLAIVRSELSLFEIGVRK